MATFKKAGLVGADFSGADLSQSLFVEAICDGARFVGADLSYTDFSHARVGETDFSRARLPYANLHGVRQGDARWDGADRHSIYPTDPDLLAAEQWQPPRINT